MNELKQIIGLTCTQARLSYGGVLTLDLGNLVEHPKLKGMFHGVWDIRSRYGAWRIYAEHKLIAGNYDDEPTLEAAMKRLTNQRLQEIKLAKSSSDARLRFSNSLMVDFLEESSKKSTWELMGPDAHISIGPGPNRTISKRDKACERLTPEEIKRFTHAERCAARWKTKIPQKAIRDQDGCYYCAYYIPLRGCGHFHDYGLCANPSSPFDGKVANVATVCEKYAKQLNGKIATQ